jgi:hypothetical protein
VSSLIRETTTPVFISASTIDLAGEASVTEVEPDFETRALLQVDPDGDGARILTTQEIGTMNVTLQLWDAEPPTRTPRDWEDVAEADVEWKSGFLDMTTDGDDWGNPANRIDLAAPGPVRIRVHGRGRNLGDRRPEGPRGGIPRPGLAHGLSTALHYRRSR